MRRSNLTIALYLLLVFASGALVGAFGHRLFTGTPVAAKAPTKPTPEEVRRQYLKEMKGRVNLSPDQLKKVNVILDQTQARFHEARDRHNQELKIIRENQVEKIHEILTAQQIPEYEKFRLEREQRAKKAAAQNAQK
jgi:hypothetical protein